MNTPKKNQIIKQNRKNIIVNNRIVLELNQKHINRESIHCLREDSHSSVLSENSIHSSGNLLKEQ